MRFALPAVAAPRPWLPLALAAVCVLAASSTGRAQTVNFEDVVIGTFTTCGDPPMVSQNVPILPEPFYYFGGGSACRGFFVTTGHVNATHELALNNTNARFIFPGVVSALTLDYEYSGGNLNLRVNGQFINVNNLAGLNGVWGFAFLGQIQVQVLATQIVFTPVTGAIFDFAIGGQEFWIDNVHYVVDYCFDSTPPISTITSPTNGACICAQVDIIGTAADPDDGLGTYILQYRRLFDNTWTTFASGNAPVVNGVLGTFKPAQLGLPQGVYLIQLKVTNACGDDEEYLIAVYYDNAFDDLHVDSPADGGIVGGVVCFDGTVYDNGCFAFYTVGFRKAGSGDPYSPVDPANPTYFATKINEVFATWDTVALSLSDNDYEIHIHAETACGFAADVDLLLTVDNTWPTAEITDPINCEGVTGSVPIIGTAFDEHLAGWVLQFTGGPYNNWVTISSGNTNVIDGLLGTWNTDGLPPCCYTVRLVVTDLAVVNCNSAIHHQSEFEISVDVNHEPCPLVCDINGDGVVDFADINPFVICLLGSP